MTVSQCFSALIMVLVATTAFSQEPKDQLKTVVEEAWKHAFKQEGEEIHRLVRFTGFLEGLFRIRAPDVWRNSTFAPPYFDENVVIAEVQVSESERLVVKSTENTSHLYVSLLDRNDSIDWDVKPYELFPNLINKNSRMWISIVFDERHFYLFGKYGAMRFIQVLSRKDGSVLLHFGFLTDRDRNYGVLDK